MSEAVPPTSPDGVNVVPLGVEEAVDPGPPPTAATSRLHGVAITAMALFALVGVGSMLAFVTVGWTGNSGRIVIAVVVLSAVGFLASASTAVFTAARDTYARGPQDNTDGAGKQRMEE